MTGAGTLGTRKMVAGKTSQWRTTVWIWQAWEELGGRTGVCVRSSQGLCSEACFP